MGRPIFLCGLAPLTNSSFESDTTDGVAPTGWDTSASVNGTNLSSGVGAQSAGPGIPSTRTLRQMVAGNVAGNKAIARQRIAIGDVPADLRALGIELAVVASVYGATSFGYQNAKVDIVQYSGGTTTPGSGTPLTAPTSRYFDIGTEGTLAKVVAQTIHASCAYFDIRLTHDIAAPGSYDAAAYTYWDRVISGFILELTKGFAAFDTKTNKGYFANEGDGTFEIVRVRKPRTEISCVIKNVMADSIDHDTLTVFSNWLDGGSAGAMAIWGDRDYLTNQTRHFQRCYHDPSFEVTWPRGVTRRDFEFKFIAPGEGA